LNSNMVLRKSGLAGRCLECVWICANEEVAAQRKSYPETALQKRRWVWLISWGWEVCGLRLCRRRGLDFARPPRGAKVRQH